MHFLTFLLWPFVVFSFSHFQKNRMVCKCVCVSTPAQNAAYGINKRVESSTSQHLIPQWFGMNDSPFRKYPWKSIHTHTCQLIACGLNFCDTHMRCCSSNGCCTLHDKSHLNCEHLVLCLFCYCPGLFVCQFILDSIHSMMITINSEHLSSLSNENKRHIHKYLPLCRRTKS